MSLQSTPLGTWKGATAFPSFAGLMQPLVMVLARWRRALRHRREAAILVMADDRALADIGLTRTDLRDAFSEPVWRDPTRLLARRAGERRDGRSPAARRAVAAMAQPGFSQPPTDRPARWTY